MRRMQIAAAVLGVVVFAGVVLALGLGDTERAPESARPGLEGREGTANARRGTARLGERIRADARTRTIDRRGVKEQLERDRSRFSGNDAVRLGDRLDSMDASFEEPEDPQAGKPRVVVPNTGEGAEVDDWDGLSPAARIDRARREVDRALAEAGRARDDETRERWQAHGAQALSAVRADFYAVGDEAGYADLEARLEP